MPIEPLIAKHNKLPQQQYNKSRSKHGSLKHSNSTDSMRYGQDHATNSSSKDCVVIAVRCPDDTSTDCNSEDSICLRSVLRIPSLLSRALVLLMTWFTLYFSGYGVVLGSGALPGSM